MPFDAQINVVSEGVRPSKRGRYYSKPIALLSLTPEGLIAGIHLRGAELILSNTLGTDPKGRPDSYSVPISGYSTYHCFVYSLPFAMLLSEPTSSILGELVPAPRFHLILFELPTTDIRLHASSHMVLSLPLTASLPTVP